MEIYFAKTIQIIKWVKVSVNFAAKNFEVLVKTEDGKVVGDMNNGLHTSYLIYLNDTNDSLKQIHFEKIKQYVETHIK